MSISVIVPSVGRKTLINTLVSILNQSGFGPDDEIVLVMDGYHAPEVTALSDQIKYIELEKRVGDYGNTARDVAIKAAKGTHLVFCDDDDIMAVGAMFQFKGASEADPKTPWVFRMKYGPHPHALRGYVLWQTPEIKPANVGTPMMLVPNVPNLPKWAAAKDSPYSDYIWIDKINQMWDNDLRFSSGIVCVVRPDEQQLHEEGLQ